MFDKTTKQDLYEARDRIRKLEDKVFALELNSVSRKDIRDSLLADEYRFKLLADAIGMEFKTEPAQPSKTVLVVKETPDVSDKEA